EVLNSFILYQHHQQHVTQPLLLEYLRDLGVDISSGELSNLLTRKLDEFHEEKDEILTVGMAVSRVLHTDDTGARHAGKSGYCTHIGNELFAWFSSTESKSRINFLECLSQGVERRYVLNAGALEYLAQQKLPKPLQSALSNQPVDIDHQEAWEQWLTTHGIQRPRHRKIVTEGALMGGLLAQGIPSDLVIMSDDAGQFNIFDHALCWIHAERVI
ncbi:MAG: transposase, partial [Planctomycetaceae bacterium]|nr:transposase [Planctomycetaceae bacterium]